MINAIFHTDYSQKGAPIKSAFLDDRIEIENPESKHTLKLSGSTPGYLSIDFYSRQPKELRDRNCYVIRTGKGNFVIFDENRYGFFELRILGDGRSGSERAVPGEI